MSRNLRVLHLYRTYFPDTQGGLEEVIRQIALNTNPCGVENVILCASPSSDEKTLSRPEATVHRSKISFEIASCTFSFPAIAEFRKLVRWTDIVHYHFPWPFADMMHFTAKVRKPTLLTYHSDIVRQRALKVLYSPLMNRFLSSVDRIVCTSPNYLDTSNVLLRFGKKVEVIPIGLDEALYPTAAADDLKVAESKYGKDFFLFVGVLRYYKGLHVLLEAAQGAPYQVVIVGSGPTETALRRQAARQGLHNVTFTGYLPDSEKRALLHLCRGVVFPSLVRSEAFGVTLLEGSIFARPLISTELGSGTSHVNVDGQTGLVVQPASPIELREAMDLLWSNTQLARTMGREARKRYDTLFTGRLMGDRYYNVYRQLTNDRLTTTV